MSPLDRLRASPRPVTAVEVRCPKTGHLGMSVHPALRPDSPNFTVWQRTRQLAPTTADRVQFMEIGGGTEDDGWERLPERCEQLTVHEVLNHEPWTLACRCSRWVVTGDELYEALSDWRDRDNSRPVVLR